jgi:hypothetical protein
LECLKEKLIESREILDNLDYPKDILELSLLASEGARVQKSQNSRGVKTHRT